MVRSGRGRSKKAIGGADDEKLKNECRAQGVLAGAITIGVSVGSYAMKGYTDLDWSKTPFWAETLVLITYSGFALIIFSVGGLLGWFVGNFGVYPIRTGDTSKGIIALLVASALGLFIVVVGLIVIGVVISSYT